MTTSCFLQFFIQLICNVQALKLVIINVERNWKEEKKKSERREVLNLLTSFPTKVKIKKKEQAGSARLLLSSMLGIQR